MFSLQRRNAVIKRLAERTDNISAAKFAEAIRVLAEQIEQEMHKTKRSGSETLELLNASLAMAKRRRIQREQAPQLVNDLPESALGCGASIPQGD